MNWEKHFTLLHGQDKFMDK